MSRVRAQDEAARSGHRRYPCTYFDPRLRQLVEREKPKLGRRLKALVPVDLFGRTADMDPIMQVAKEFDIAVVEDSAQTNGAMYKGRRAGTIGDLAAFSLYPSKNIGCYGDGGAVVVRSQSAAVHLKMLRNSGQQRCYHLYVPRHTQRDRLMSHLEQCGVGTAAHYRVHIHFQHARADLAFGLGAFPVAEAAACQVASLPSFPQLAEEEVAYMAESVDSFGG